MNFDLEAEMLNARLHVRQTVRRSVLLAKTAIHLEAEKARDDIDEQVRGHMARLGLRGFFSHLNRTHSDVRK